MYKSSRNTIIQNTNSSDEELTAEDRTERLKKEQAAITIQNFIRRSFSRYKDNKLLFAVDRRGKEHKSLLGVFFRGDSRSPREIFAKGFSFNNRYEHTISISPNFENAAAFPYDETVTECYVYVFILDTVDFARPYSKEDIKYRGGFATMMTRNVIIEDVINGFSGLNEQEKSGHPLVSSAAGKTLNQYMNPIEIRTDKEIPKENIIGAFSLHREWNGAMSMGGKYIIRGFEESTTHKMDEADYIDHLNAIMSYVDTRMKKGHQSGMIKTGTALRSGWAPSGATLPK
ncbi:hypothetical protein [Enterobacter asburiae]|uniref:hypothetical protein n=1 Tax=Enterobacter asburiae TaxID=61645 RepID=UPI001FFFC212|nr:hypothetical protein [Enterobacter asburiae]MCK2177855.1 hypothetical protein [Enterobacter asburiae]